VSRPMPRFGLSEYTILLRDLSTAGYRFGAIAATTTNEPPGRVVFLRHDVDLHLRSVESLAELEARCGVSATYYVPLTLHFNPLYPENRRILHAIRDCGHAIGLHYDLGTYPTEPDAARRHLDWEADILGAIVERPIRTICLHNPHKGQPDPFRELSKYTNPDSSSFRQDCLYVSDSCRAWRDESLLRCFGDAPPRRVLLNTHPELWLDGSISDRMEYLEKVLRQSGVRQHLDYFDYVRQVWSARDTSRLQSVRPREDTAGGPGEPERARDGDASC
jgi:hypothetical protein